MRIIPQEERYCVKTKLYEEIRRDGVLGYLLLGEILPVDEAEEECFAEYIVREASGEGAGRMLKAASSGVPGSTVSTHISASRP